ncbi:MAG: ParB/RepB/Spo0J family partition protein [Chloroflexota bacterium]|nr:ParB/RepB/Spo0J family partition protein [Chloroflexota bacterium]
MPRRKSFYEDSGSNAQEHMLEQNLQALMAPQRPQTTDLPIARIRPNPFQARRNFDDIEELAAAIRAHGFTTRLRVRPDPSEPDSFQLVFGERRLRAAEEAGLTMVPCEVATHTDDEMIEIGLAENIQRRDLDPMEEARAFRIFIDQRGYTERRLAERIGKDRGYIQNRLALLRAPEEVQQLVAQRPDALSAARAIAQLPTVEQRQQLIEGVASGALTHKDVLALVNSASLAPASRPTVVDHKQGDADIPAQPRESLSVSTTSSPLTRALDRDILAVRAVFARWRLSLPKSKAEERARMLGFVDTHLAELEALTEALRSMESASNENVRK